MAWALRQWIGTKSPRTRSTGKSADPSAGLYLMDSSGKFLPETLKQVFVGNFLVNVCKISTKPSSVTIEIKIEADYMDELVYVHEWINH